MLRVRVIPCLDVANGRVVKGTRFVDLVDEGDPPDLAERYAREGADELVYLDISAAPEGRGTLLDIVERTARRAFVPLTVGGGVRSVVEMRDVLRAGADKVSLNTAAVRDPALVRRCARRFGSQAVVVAIDARRIAVGSGADRGVDRGAGRGPDRGAGRGADRVGPETAPREGTAPRGPTAPSELALPPSWEVVVKGGREPTGLDAVEWAARVVALGAGELLVTSIDRDGTQSGYDTTLLRAIADRVGVPVIASGGASGPADFVAAVVEGGVSAVLAASIFHRRQHAIEDIKAAMAAAGIPVRRSEAA